MNQLIVVAFDHFDDARSAIKSLRDLEHRGLIRFEDTAILQVDPDGTAHLKNEVSGTTETAAVIGALVGGFLTFMFPPLGLVVGAAAGALIGSQMKTGLRGGRQEEAASGTLRAVPGDQAGRGRCHRRRAPPVPG